MRMSPAVRKVCLAALVITGLGALGFACLAWLAAPPHSEATGGIVRPGAGGYERWAREQFMRRHPGEKPLNWAVAEAAVRFHEMKPMGRFVLGLTPGEWGNDCSDFVECAIDEGLGVGARFNRGSDEHLYGRDRRLWDGFYRRPDLAVQPGDVVAVRHSPWYAPYEEAAWHVGIVGADGMVYDFVKLRSWKDARYGRNDFDWFVRHSLGPQQVIIRRLAAKYRYLIEPLPEPDPGP